MTRNSALFCLLLLSFFSRAQITLIGHAMFNGNSVNQVNIVVKHEQTILKSFNTLSKPDFKLVLDFGKVYTVYFQIPKSPVLVMEVVGNTIPAEKQNYLMTYELNIPFVYKADEDVDTTVFSAPFHRVIFDGKRLMVEDTMYNNAFLKRVVKPVPKHPEKLVTGADLREGRHVFVGSICFNEDKNAMAKHAGIELIGKSGNLLKSSSSNHFGQFCMSGIELKNVSKIRLTSKCATTCSVASLYATNGELVANTTITAGNCEWTLSENDLMKFSDDYFTYTIGGKLVSSSFKEKKFFAKKDIYLCNRYHMVVQRATTNLIGAFVFQDVRPERGYYLCANKSDLQPGEKIDLLTKDDILISRFDTAFSGRQALRFYSGNNKRFDQLSISHDEIKMDVRATIFGDNVNNPIGKLKILLLNDDYEVIDSAITDNFGTFKFKYLPFLKRFYLSAENTENVLDVFKNILIYSSDDNLIKIMTHQKGNKFTYSPVQAEISSLRDIELEDPWLELMDEKKTVAAEKRTILLPGKSIVENILFENNKSEISPQSREVLDKIILVLSANKQLKIEVGAHTDSKGDAEANLHLSESRAKTVKEYMVKNGIERSRIVAKGYGETKLLNNCKDHLPCNEAEHAQNRRIEFKVLGE